MKKQIEFIKQWIIITCCSFTVEILSFILLGEDYVPALEASSLQQTFIICVCASFFAILVIYHDFQHAWLNSCAPLLAVYTTVFLMGTVMFGLIPIDLGVYTVIFILGVIIYLICSFLFYRKNQSDADFINQQLKRRESDDE